MTERQRSSGRLDGGRDREDWAGRDDSRGGSGDEEEDLEKKFLCFVPIRTVATVLQPRKGVRLIRIKSLRTMGSPGINARSDRDLDHDDFDKEREEDEQTTPIMQLSFEFQITTNGIMRMITRLESQTLKVLSLSPKKTVAVKSWR